MIKKYIERESIMACTQKQEYSNQMVNDSEPSQGFPPSQPLVWVKVSQAEDQFPLGAYQPFRAEGTVILAIR